MIYRLMLNEPFGKSREYVDGLTDRELYAWHFRKYDREADAMEREQETTMAEAGKTLEQRRDEHLALCRSFGASEAEAEASWADWLKENGG